MGFQKIAPEDWRTNPFTAIGKQWYLLTAGAEDAGYNFMTCSWGSVGVLWNQPAVTCYVRHSRHTFGFMEQQELFTLSFFDEEYRKALAFAGSHSGRSYDKVSATGLHPIGLDGAVTFEEANTVLICRKRYAADLPIEALPADVAKSYYADGDTHRMYIGEILAVYEKQ